MEGPTPGSESSSSGVAVLRFTREEFCAFVSGLVSSGIGAIPDAEKDSDEIEELS